MSKEVKFVDGLRAFKPHANAPDFVKATLELNISELVGWLNAQGGEKVRLDLKESRNGTYYCSVNDFTPDPSRGNTSNDSQRPAPADVPEPPPADDYDDIPF